jgi:hypothetical protein
MSRPGHEGGPRAAGPRASWLQRTRELADYDAAVTFSADDAAAEIAAADAFSSEARALLVKEGWLAAQS